MPQYASYPLITTMAGADKLLVHQSASGTEKTITYDNFARTSSMPFINILNYGAVGNGTTDDTAAITAALAAATAGSVVLFPPTVNGYVITSQISIPLSNVTLLGFGGKITGLNQTQFRKFLVSGKTNVTFDGLFFDGNYVSGVPVTAQGSIEVTNSSDIVIRNCRFENVLNSGIYIFGPCNRVLVDGNIFSNYFCAFFSDDNGVVQPAYTRIINNEFKPGLGTRTTPFSGAIKMSGFGTADSVVNHVIANNTIDSPGQMGIEIQTYVNGVSITGNTVYNAGFGISLSVVYRGAVSGNTMNGCDYCGIELATSSFCSASGNVVNGSSRGIVVDQSNNCSVVGNSLRNTSLYLFGPTNTMLVGNSVYNGPIYVQSSNHTTIVGNTITSVGSGPSTPTVGITIDVDGGSTTLYGPIIKDNTFIGNYDYALISFYAASGTAVMNGIVISGNDCSVAIAGLEGVIYNFIPAVTITNYRSFGNIPNTAHFHQSSLDLAGSCTVHLTGDQNIATGVEPAITWDAVYYDDSSSPFTGRRMWDPSTPTKLVLPPYAHRVRVTANIRWESVATGSRRVKIKSSNAAGVYPFNAVWACTDTKPGVLAGDAADTSLTTPVIDVQNITDFTVTVEQDSASNPLKVLGTGNFLPGTNFCLQILD